MPEAYDALYAYAMERGRAAFPLQHVVDAHAAQTAEPGPPGIGLTFALVGLYLKVVRGHDGRAVQRAHMRLARRKGDWPSIALPADRGALRAEDVMAVPPGPERDAAIDRWCESVWDAYADGHDALVAWLATRGLSWPPA